ncbi:hypothetical protein F8B43_4326 [Methylorubrum populi]|uniref:Uncharacterized protein n=1 Tax=Methylorubrum populi TaxID=223967 RepID=A0A833J3L9_9HYPH|nr:hypothetical protein F8B43_4326 [Methylorubrum populi]
MRSRPDTPSPTPSSGRTPKGTVKADRGKTRCFDRTIHGLARHPGD